MESAKLELPFIAIIPYNVQIHPTLSDACKLYFGQIVQLSKKTGYMWATDDQLAEMKGCGKRTIERWNLELEEAGFIRRETRNVPVQDKEKGFHWEKQRRVYFDEAFQSNYSQKKQAEKKQEINEENSSGSSISKNVCGTAKSGGTEKMDSKNVCGTAKNGGSYGTAKNGGINSKSLDKISKEQSGQVVVPISLQKIELQDTLRVKISQEFSADEIDKAVERCIKWKGRPSDECGIMTALSRADSWKDNPTPEEMEESNTEFLNSLSHLDGKSIGLTNITVGNKYIEFVSGMKVTTYSIDQDSFKSKVNDYIQYLKCYEEKMNN